MSENGIGISNGEGLSPGFRGMVEEILAEPDVKLTDAEYALSVTDDPLTASVKRLGRITSLENVQTTEPAPAANMARPVDRMAQTLDIPARSRVWKSEYLERHQTAISYPNDDFDSFRVTVHKFVADFVPPSGGSTKPVKIKPSEIVFEEAVLHGLEYVADGTVNRTAWITGRNESGNLVKERVDGLGLAAFELGRSLAHKAARESGALPVLDLNEQTVKRLQDLVEPPKFELPAIKQPVEAPKATGLAGVVTRVGKAWTALTQS